MIRKPSYETVLVVNYKFFLGKCPYAEYFFIINKQSLPIINLLG